MKLDPIIAVKNVEASSKSKFQQSGILDKRPQRILFNNI